MCSYLHKLFRKIKSFLYALELDKFIYGLNQHVDLPILKKFAIIQRLKKQKSKFPCKINNIIIEEHTAAILFFTGFKR